MPTLEYLDLCPLHTTLPLHKLKYQPDAICFSIHNIKKPKKENAGVFDSSEIMASERIRGPCLADLEGIVYSDAER